MRPWNRDGERTVFHPHPRAIFQIQQRTDVVGGGSRRFEAYAFYDDVADQRVGVADLQGSIQPRSAHNDARTLAAQDDDRGEYLYGRADVVHARFQAHAAALVRQRIDRSLNVFAGRDVNGAAAAAFWWPRHTAIGLIVGKGDDGQPRIMAMDTARRRMRESLHRGVGGACCGNPIVAAVESAAGGVETELNLYAVFQHHPHACHRHRDQAGAGRRVKIDDDIVVRVAHYALLIPAPHAGVARIQRVGAAAGNQIRRQRG